MHMLTQRTHESESRVCAARCFLREPKQQIWRHPFRCTMHVIRHPFGPCVNSVFFTLPLSVVPPPTDMLICFGETQPTDIRRCQNNFETLKVTALDLSLFNLRVAKQKLKGVEGVTYVESNAEHMAIENESQDVVTCNFVLSTMPKEAQVNTTVHRM